MKINSTRDGYWSTFGLMGSMASIALLSGILILGMNAVYGGLAVTQEANSKFVINQWYYDTELQRDVGILVSRIIIENETDHSIQGYIADSQGTKLDIVKDRIQVVMVKYVFNNTASTKWRIHGWVNDGLFEVEKPEGGSSAEAIRIYVGPIDYTLDEESLAGHSRPLVFINPAWAEFAVASSPSTDGNLGDSQRQRYIAGMDSVASSAIQNPYDPATYEPKHCSYLSDLADAYTHCTELYVSESEDHEELSTNRNEKADNEERTVSLLAVSESQSRLTENQLSTIRVGNITLVDVGDISIEGNTVGGANFTYPVISANDTNLGDISGSVMCSTPSGIFFPINSTITVSCSLRNDANGTVTGTFSVTVTYSTPPLIANHTKNLVIEGNATGGAIVAYRAPNATDIVDASVETHCLPASGSFFVLGSTMVSCVAYDDLMNNATTTFNVTVIDTSGPEIHLPSDRLSYKTSNDDGKRVQFIMNASDVVDPEPSIICIDPSGEQFEPGQVFPVGTTTLTCQAFDHSGNASQKEKLVIRIRLAD